MGSNAHYKGGAGEPVRVGEFRPTGQPCIELTPPPSCMVVFGASGDLAGRKLIPALYTLFRAGLLKKDFFITGAARTQMDADGFREQMKKAAGSAGKKIDGKWDEFASRLYYRPLEYGDIRSYRELKGFIEEKESVHASLGNRIFYLSTPPSVYGAVISTIKEAGLKSGRGWSRVVIEKPYGRDSRSAEELERVVHDVFAEEEVYRIDHYLGKDTVQNIMMLRFANSIFEPVWNRHFVDHVQITASEAIGIEKRAGYYEQAGVLRDMFQNHMLQVLSLVTMEPPSSYDARLVEYERLKVLRALRPLPLDNLDDVMVLGQYAEGEIDGNRAPGYREEGGVAKGSGTATYAAIKLFLDNWRWQGVPFYLRSGKRLSDQITEVVIQFKRVPHHMFTETITGEIGPNALVLRIQPDERVQLKFHTKIPGTRVCLRDVLMDFPYMEGYEGIKIEAYERVLLDCMLGDKTLFISSEGVELSWSFLTPVLELIDRADVKAPMLKFYGAGTTGPLEADELIEKDGRAWRRYR